MRTKTFVMTILASGALALAVTGVGAGVAAAQTTPASSASGASSPSSSGSTTSGTSTTTTPSPLIDCGALPTPDDPSHAPFNYQGQAVIPVQSDMTGQWGFWYQNCFVLLQ